MFKRHKDLNKFIYFIVLVIGILIGYSISNRKQIECEQLLNETDSKNTNDEIISFEGFNNITGTINITIISLAKVLIMPTTRTTWRQKLQF